MLKVLNFSNFVKDTHKLLIWSYPISDVISVVTKNVHDFTLPSFSMVLQIATTNEPNLSLERTSLCRVMLWAGSHNSYSKVIVIINKGVSPKTG